MKSNLQHNEAFLEKLIRAPRGLEKKVVSKYHLDPFFSVISLEDLVFTLHQFATSGYLKYEVILSHEYDDWEEARNRATLDTSPLIPIDPFGTLRRNKYRLAILDREVKTNTPLTTAEVSVVLRVLPANLAEQFLRFRLSNIDQKRLREIVSARPDTSSPKVKVDNYYVVRHKGLIVGISDVTYNRMRVPMTKQQRALLRAFVAQPSVTLSYDTLYDNPEIFKSDKTHEDPLETVSKLISATHKKLKPFVGECIFNKPEFGWYLKIG